MASLGDPDTRAPAIWMTIDLAGKLLSMKMFSVIAEVSALSARSLARMLINWCTDMSSLLVCLSEWAQTWCRLPPTGGWVIRSLKYRRMSACDCFSVRGRWGGFPCLTTPILSHPMLGSLIPLVSRPSTSALIRSCRATAPRILPL